MKLNTPLILSLGMLCSSTLLFAGTPITAELETRSHFDDAAGNNTDVDDPAIWVHPTDKTKSLVAATLKKGGLDVYNLDGKLLQHIPAATAPSCHKKQQACAHNNPGRFNNADVIYDFKLAGKHVDLIVVSDRGLDKMAIYKINREQLSTRPLSNITAPNQDFIFSSNQQQVNQGHTAYGLATVKTDKTYAYVTQNSTPSVAQLTLYDNGDNTIAYKKVQELHFPDSFPLPNGKQWTPCSDDDNERPHFEGMVADKENDSLYLGQENVGIWRTSLSQPGNKKHWQLFAKAKDFGIPYSRTWVESEQEFSCTLHTDQDPGFGNKELYADIEGLTLYTASQGKGYLLVSSQGNNTVALYKRRKDNAYVGSFTVADGAIDGVNETDGMMVVNVNLGSQFPQGLLVMQDGQNDPPLVADDGSTREGSNFKYISWGKVAAALKLAIDTRDQSRQ